MFLKKFTAFMRMTQKNAWTTCHVSDIKRVRFVISLTIGEKQTENLFLA